MKKTSENRELFWRQTTETLDARSAEKVSTSGKNILTADIKEKGLEAYRGRSWANYFIKKLEWKKKVT